MFIIADIRHSTVPSYLWKVLSDGTALITVELSQSPQFKTKQIAKEFLSTIKNSSGFEFNICELTIKK